MLQLVQFSKDLDSATATFLYTCTLQNKRFHLYDYTILTFVFYMLRVCISLKMDFQTRMLIHQVRNRKRNNLKFPPLFFCFHLNFQLLEVPHSKFKKVAINIKIFFPVPSCITLVFINVMRFHVKKYLTASTFAASSS